MNDRVRNIQRYVYRHARINAANAANYAFLPDAEAKFATSAA